MNDTVKQESGTYFQNIDSGKYWNEQDRKWVDSIEEATNYGHKKLDIKKFNKPANSVRVRV